MLGMNGMGHSSPVVGRFEVHFFLHAGVFPTVYGEAADVAYKSVGSEPPADDNREKRWTRSAVEPALSTFFVVDCQ